MSDKRTCKRCGGEEFQMRTGSGIVIEWRDTSGHLQTWFCTDCDWGSSRGTERER